MPILAVIIIIFRGFIDFDILSQPIAVSLAVLLAIPIIFLAAMIIGFLAFWFEEPWPARSLYWILSGLFGGMYAPMEFMPAMIQKIAALLPFKYAIYFPLRLFTGELGPTQITQGFLGQIVWILVLGLAVALMWRQGLRKYSAIGR